MEKPEDNNFITLNREGKIFKLENDFETNKFRLFLCYPLEPLIKLKLFIIIFTDKVFLFVSKHPGSVKEKRIIKSIKRLKPIVQVRNCEFK